MNAVQLFRDAARAHPERAAFIERGRRTTYAELWERVARVAGAPLRHPPGNPRAHPGGSPRHTKINYEKLRGRL